MSDSPLKDASTHLAPNTFTVEGGAEQGTGAELRTSLTHTRGTTTSGVSAEVTEKKGWSVWGFFRKTWGS